MKQNGGSAPLRLAAIAGAALTLNVVVWVLLPALLEGSIRLDVAEHVIQGREWLLAYPKHPPLSMWLVNFASTLGSARYLAIYLLGQGLALAGLVAATFVLRDEAPAARVLAILIGLATPAMTYMTIQVNHNIGVLPFWGLALAAGYFSFTRGRMWHWLLFGAAVGLGMWAKYSILHLAIPLALLFFAVPEWRRMMATPGPWLAGALAAAIVAPHVLALMQVPNPLGYALRTFSAGPLSHFAMCLGFLLYAALVLALMGIVAAGAVGFRPLLHQVAESFAGPGRNRLALYLHVALFGPIALIAIAALLFGVRPRFHWLAPIALSGAVWWADKAKAVDEGLLRRPLTIAGALGALLAGSYVAVRLFAPLVAAAPSYPDFDGPALARLAERHWQEVGGPIPYIVSLGRQHGRQAAGSIVFDLADHPPVFEEADSRLAPWIDFGDLAQRGALVVSASALSPQDQVAGRLVEHIRRFERPTVRAGFRNPRMIHFGILRPASR
jgi:4-amino-4-deoxy-L-arabinose transferase-like glycosyltransferase